MQDNHNQVVTNEYFLEPGHIYFCKEYSLIKAVLGSCVSVCLWDEEKKVGGMNHFIYPSINDKKKATSKYGNVATIALIKLMQKHHCNPDNIIAQIYGGALPESDKHDFTGEKNVSIARKILHKHNIKIVSEDIAGHMGRKIVFDTSSGHVAVLKVHKIRETDWYE